MELLLAISTGGLYAGGIYMLLRRSLVKMIIGLMLIGNGANLLIFLLGRITRSSPPLIGETEKSLSGIYADPIPQALILTAIVIGFGLQAFAIVLIKKIYAVLQTDDMDSMTSTDLDI
jgi:multicomponent Na+:H+ antiporter subunit C